MDVKDIVNTYEKTESMKETAKVWNVSEQKVRKILITEGKYKSDISIKVNERHMKGMSVADIAGELKISTKAVNSYLPYEKGVYNLDNPTDNAIKIRRCRSCKNVID